MRAGRVDFLLEAQVAQLHRHRVSGRGEHFQVGPGVADLRIGGVHVEDAAHALVVEERRRHGRGAGSGP